MKRLFEMILNWLKSLFFGEPQETPVEPEPTDGGLFNNWGPHFVDQGLQFLNSPVKDIWCNLAHCVGGGDADDQVKLVLTGENGCVVDIEISTVLTIYGNLYEIWGSRGSLVIPSNGLEMQLKYLRSGCPVRR